MKRQETVLQAEWLEEKWKWIEGGDGREKNWLFARFSALGTKNSVNVQHIPEIPGSK